VRALHRPDLTGHRAPHGSAKVLAHRHAHNDDETCRPTREHPPLAANTFRAAQDSLLLTIEERYFFWLGAPPFEIRQVIGVALHPSDQVGLYRAEGRNR
jgi:hypothetical protein